MSRLVALLVLALASWPVAGPAATAPSAAAAPALCVEAARAAARRHGIPSEVMQAITLVETRRPVGGVARPWPWTLNVEGEGHWFETRDAALGRALREIGRGRESVDLGCFQLNWRWHGVHFATPDEMLDPLRAADYAARFLRGLYDETGDWLRAAGHYHSRTPVHAARYRAQIARALARLEVPTAAPRPPARPGAGRRPATTPPTTTLRPATPPASDRIRSVSHVPPGAVALSMLARPAQPWFAAGTRAR